MTFFAEIEKHILKFIWNFKGHEIVKIIFQKKNSVGGLNVLISKLTTKLQ